LHRLAVGLLPVSLCFWYYRLMIPADHARVYFTYDSVLFFLSDGLAFLAVLAWLCARLIGHEPASASGQRLLLLSLFALVILASFSTVWSITPALSLYTAAHLWLMFGLFMSVRGEPESWRALGFGCVAALILQSSFAGWEFLAQSTAFLAPLRLTWPGTLVPTTSGPSVVMLADGTRWLRAYGTLPHPNILGGFLLALMAGPLTIFLRDGGRRWWALVLFGIATVALMLTFSRSAWLGYIAGGVVVILHRRSLGGARLWWLVAVALACLIAVAIPLRSLILVRAPGSQVTTEAGSTYERILLGNQAWDMLRTRPLGSGAGAFVVQLAAQIPETDPVEPVHNVVLLAASELGWLAGLLWLIAGVAIVFEIRRAHGAGAVVLSAIVIGLIVIGLGDHYLWSLAPGRTLASLFFGAWAGKMRMAISAT
jgi:O-antigen ligase